MSVLEDLLKKGRELLKATQEKEELLRLEEERKKNNFFDSARKLALKAFHPLSGEVLVKPCSPPKDWNFDDEFGDRLEFYICPFHGECRSVSVSVVFRGLKESGEWRYADYWHEDQGQPNFSVSVSWQKKGKEIVPSAYSNLGSLPEALALAEQCFPEWTLELNRPTPEPAKTKESTVEENLLFYLRQFVLKEQEQ